MFFSLEILFGEEGISIHQFGEVKCLSSTDLLIKIKCKPKSISKIIIEYIEDKNIVRHVFNDKEILNYSGLNFHYKQNVEIVDDMEIEDKYEDFGQELHNSLEKCFSEMDECDINRFREYFSAYFSLNSSLNKNFNDFKFSKIIFLEDIDFLMAGFLVQYASYISFIQLNQLDYFVGKSPLKIETENSMYNLCKNILFYFEYLLSPIILSSFGTLNYYSNFCLYFVRFWGKYLCDGPESSKMYMNIMKSSVEYVIRKSDEINSQQDLMLSKLSIEYDKLEKLKNQICFTKREIRKTVMDILAENNTIQFPKQY